MTSRSPWHWTDKVMERLDRMYLGQPEPRRPACPVCGFVDAGIRDAPLKPVCFVCYRWAYNTFKGWGPSGYTWIAMPPAQDPTTTK